MESEVVIICEVYNKEDACDMRCQDVNNDCFCESHMKPDSMTQVLSHARKITCAGVRRMRGLGVVFTPPSLTRESPLPASETP